MIAGVPQALGRTAIGLVAAIAVLWGLGLDLLHALVLGAAAIALIALRKSPAVNNDQDWPDQNDIRSDTGARREVARLSWAMQGYESRVQRQSINRLHQIAVYRLGELGLDLDDPRDYVACESALGVRAYQVVSEPDVRPLYADFVAAVASVEKLMVARPSIAGAARPADARSAERA